MSGDGWNQGSPPIRRRHPPTGELMEVETRDGRGSEEGRSGGRQSSIAASVRPPILSKPGRTPSICEFWTSGRRLDGESGTGMLVGHPLGPPGVYRPSACACPARVCVLACISVTVLGQGPHHGRLTRIAKDRPWRGACKLHYKRPLAMCEPGMRVPRVSAWVTDVRRLTAGPAGIDGS